MMPLPLYCAVLFPYGPRAGRFALLVMLFLALSAIFVPAVTRAVGQAMIVVLLDALLPVLVPLRFDSVDLALDEDRFVLLPAVVVPLCAGTMVDERTVGVSLYVPAKPELSVGPVLLDSFDFRLREAAFRLSRAVCTTCQ